MSHAAMHHVKFLLVAPNGERLTAAEKVILGFLAEDHNEQIGIAWASIGSYAKLAGVHPRNCSKTLASLERKGVIVRHPTARLSERGQVVGQSSNEYSFVGLKVTEEHLKRLEENKQKLQKVRRIRLPFGPPGDFAGDPPATSPCPPRRYDHPLPGVSAGGPPGDFAGDPPATSPPLDLKTRSLNSDLFTDSVVDSETGIKDSPYPLSERVEIDLDSRWRNFKAALKDEMYAVPIGVEKAKRWKRVRENEDDFKSCFNEWMLLEVESLPDGVRFATFAYDGNSAATEAGIAKYSARITRLVRKHFELAADVPVSFEVRTAPAQTTAPAENKTSNGHSLPNEGKSESNGESHGNPFDSAAPHSGQASERRGNTDSHGPQGETLVEMLLGEESRDPWDRVKRELKDQLEQLGKRNVGDRLDWYAQAIEPTRLEHIDVTGKKPVWKVLSPAAKKTRAVMSLLRAQLDPVMRKVAGGEVDVVVRDEEGGE